MFAAVLDSLAAGVPVLAAHLAVALAMFAAGLAAYAWATPHAEVALVRAGNTAAAISFGAAALGLALPLAACLYAAAGGWDIVLWGAAALVLQLLLFRAADLVLRDLPARIARGEMAAATLLAALKLALAVLLASALVA